MNKKQQSIWVAALVGLIGLLVLASGAARAGQEHAAGQPADAVAVARAAVEARVDALGLTAADVAEMRAGDVVFSAQSGVTHVYFQQFRNDIPVRNAIVNVNVRPDGRILSLGNRFAPDIAGRAKGTAVALSPTAATEIAATALALAASEPFVIVETVAPGDVRLNEAGIALEPIPARLVYHVAGDGAVHLAYEIGIYTVDAEHYWQSLVDAGDGKVLAVYDLVVHENVGSPADASTVAHRPAASNPVRAAGDDAGPLLGSYRVYEIPKEYPDDGPRTLVAFPALPAASPFGWHDTDGASGPEYTITRGNNAHAYADRDDNNSPDAATGSEPEGGPSLIFDYPLDLNLDPQTYISAAVTNLFYWNNIVHDVTYLYGFDEAAGNFQVNNYGNGGFGGDPVQAEAQDGAAVGKRNNANFFTPADGAAPRMQMFVWDLTTPLRDGDLSSAIIIHEYVHGVSIRQTGGPGTVTCLNNDEQMGEGWSDFYALVMTANAADVAATSRGLGTWALGQPTSGAGIRPAPYSTDFTINNFTYADLSGQAVPHGVGFVWATMLWEMYWELVDAHGFNPDIYGGWSTGGNNLALQLVNDGLKGQVCEPGFVDGRDAILAADVALSGGVNQCRIWDAFARRGLGFSASQGSSQNTGDGTAAFDTPPGCQFLDVTPANQNICAGGNAVYTVNAGQAFTGPVTLAVGGHPAASTPSFSVNPVDPPPGSSQLTISNTGGAAPGSYTLHITGTTVVTSASTTAGLDVFNVAPGAPVLMAPANGATDQPQVVNFSWNASTNAATYAIEIATDAAMTNVVDSASGLATTSYSSTPLATNSTFYWRVRADNACGPGVFSGIWSFLTAAAPGDCSTGTAPVVHLQEDFETGGAGWSHSGTQDSWAIADTSAWPSDQGTFAYHADEPGSVSDQYLVSPAVALPSGALNLSLQYDNYQLIENAVGGCFDGAILEISTDGGGVWNQVLNSDLLTQPYHGQVSGSFGSPIGGQEAWCGDPETWTWSVVDLSAYAGQSVQFRFRMTSDVTVDRDPPQGGWTVDDVLVQSCSADALPTIYSPILFRK